jgi:NAD(P)-dependent dehydrogenase (short-subunit alcohol dehydrogenase family)
LIQIDLSEAPLRNHTSLWFGKEPRRIPGASNLLGGSFELVELDLANLKSVRACADQLLARRDTFDVIIANAGVMATPFCSLCFVVKLTVTAKP